MGKSGQYLEELPCFLLYPGYLELYLIHVYPCDLENNEDRLFIMMMSTRRLDLLNITKSALRTPAYR